MSSIIETTFLAKTRRLCPTARIESDGSRILVIGERHTLRCYRECRDGEKPRVCNFYLQRKGEADQPETDLFLGTWFDNATSALRALSTWR